MKNMIKSFLLHLIVGIVVFSVCLIFFNYRVSREKGQDYSEMTNSTYPIMEIRTKLGDYNLMSAYVDDVDISLVRNQIAVIENDETMQLCLHHYNYDITAIQYSLFTKQSEEPLEEGTLNQLESLEEEGIRTATIHFETNLEKGKTYYLKLATRLDNDTKVYYYTKVLNGDGYHFAECVEFAKHFQENLFDKAKFEENISYLEPSGKVTKSLEKVDISSSVDAVSFGNMTVKLENDPKLTVKEINDVYSVLQFDYIVSSEIRDGVIQYYDISENYKIRYSNDRMFLLDYERTMDAYYNKALYDPAKNYITLGIHNFNNVNVFSSDSGYKACFTQAGQLWYYNYKYSDVSKVFSFSSENIGDLRNTVSNHDIKILRMDDDGNIIYILYGYINRGHYEGRNGIQLFRYNAANECNEEIAFFATSIPFDRMKSDIQKFTYLNSKNVFYCLLDGDLHAIDMEKRKDKILHSGMVNENITASKEQNIIAIEENKNLTANTSIVMLDLESGKEKTFTCSADKRIRSIGFLANDFIYGTASSTNVKRNDGGTITFPMEKLDIVNIDGQVLKTYNKANRYILQTEISGSVLEMEFGQKKGNRFVVTNDKDYIRYKEEEENGQVSLVYDYSNIYWNQLSLRFPNYVYIQVEPDLLFTKVLSAEDDLCMTLERSNESKTMYYVYAEGKEIDSFDNLKEAINEADEARGHVISSNEEIMWECGYLDYAMVAGMDQVTKVKSDKWSLAACLEMLAKVNGKQKPYRKIDTSSGKISEMIQDCTGKTSFNLEGCTVDEVLYFISKGSPVLAKYNKNRYVILMSYNSTKIRYLDPVTGLSTAVDRKSLQNSLEKAGNKFYTYVEN